MDTLWLAFAVPDVVIELLAPIYEHYSYVIEAPTPRENLHLTLLWLGSADVPSYQIKKLLKPLPQSFVPTVRLTHVGRGRKREQLWAYGEALGPIINIREQLIARLKESKWQLPKQEPRNPFTPHMTVAKLYDQLSHIGIADVTLVTSFAVKEVLLYKSSVSANKTSVYSRVETISLV
jgi:2'-5' RNA ligase